MQCCVVDRDDKDSTGEGDVVMLTVGTKTQRVNVMMWTGKTKTQRVKIPAL